MCLCVATYHHVERVERLEAGDHGCYKRVSCDFGKHVALVPDVLDLREVVVLDTVFSRAAQVTG